MVKIMNIVSAVSWTDIQTEVMITSTICNQDSVRICSLCTNALIETKRIKVYSYQLSKCTADEHEFYFSTLQYKKFHLTIHVLEDKQLVTTNVVRVYATCASM